MSETQGSDEFVWVLETRRMFDDPYIKDVYVTPELARAAMEALGMVVTEDSDGDLDGRQPPERSYLLEALEGFAHRRPLHRA